MEVAATGSLALQKSSSSILSASFTDLDGRLIIIAATNRPAALDPALRRAGRIDCEISIPLPNHRVELMDCDYSCLDPDAVEADVAEISWRLIAH